MPNVRPWPLFSKPFCIHHCRVRLVAMSGSWSTYPMSTDPVRSAWESQKCFLAFGEHRMKTLKLVMSFFWSVDLSAFDMLQSVRHVFNRFHGSQNPENPWSSATCPSTLARSALLPPSWQRASCQSNWCFDPVRMPNWCTPLSSLLYNAHTCYQRTQHAFGTSYMTIHVHNRNPKLDLKQTSQDSSNTKSYLLLTKRSDIVSII